MPCSATCRPKNSSAPSSDTWIRTLPQFLRRRRSFPSKLLTNRHTTQNLKRTLKMAIKHLCRWNRSFWCKQMNLVKRTAFTNSASLLSQIRKPRPNEASTSRSVWRALNSWGRKPLQSTSMTSPTSWSRWSWIQKSKMSVRTNKWPKAKPWFRKNIGPRSRTPSCSWRACWLATMRLARTEAIRARI